MKNALCSTTMQLNRVLVVSKLSRYEYERLKCRHIPDKDFKLQLQARGSDVDKLLNFHHLHKKYESSVVQAFVKAGIQVDVVNRLNYTIDKVSEADLVVPTGGDGTFLLAASRIFNNAKPVLGLNSDPNRSEGHLCLPRRYSDDVGAVIDRLRSGRYEWLLRSRIRTRVHTQRKDVVPKFLHEVDATCDVKTKQDDPIQCGQLPVLALNEVFVGETVSARVSHLQMRIDGCTEQTNLKCSGVCICTGTGSTSWHLSINRLPVQSVAELLNMIAQNDASITLPEAKELAKQYNRHLTFKPDDTRMAYTIRDLISAGVWPHPKGIKSRGFATKLEMRSNCFDASLVVDGGISFPFNDGTIVILEVNPSDSLRTILLPDD